MVWSSTTCKNKKIGPGLLNKFNIENHKLYTILLGELMSFKKPRGSEADTACTRNHEFS